jgi:hypothetical protein
VRRHLAALAGAVTLLFGAGAGTALADSPTQAALQAAGTSQSATSDATSTQVKPTNSATSVRIGSPGNDGSVDQSNTSAAASAAANLAGTTQQATQDQSGSGTQAAAQQAYTDQSADSSATSTQDHPSNSAISVRIGSPGNGGDVQQSNASEAESLAANAAKTDQAVQQQQQGSGSCKCGGGGTQVAEQKAKTDQSASSDATSTQYKPSNSAISVRIGSPGNDGSVDQSNTSAAGSFAGNLAKTDQSAQQSQGGSSCGCGGDAVQAAGQFAHTGQYADSDATSKQIDPSNSATSVRIASPGNGGDVRQSNDSFAGSFAGNAALTQQTADQQQGSGGHGSGVQALEQDAATWQDADSSATSTQYHPSNDVTGVRIASPGNDGSVDQSNSSTALSFAGNLAKTDQAASQSQGGSGCGCGGDAVQAVGQFAWTGQSADSSATSEQKGASNSVTPISIGGKGKDGHECGCQPYAPSPSNGGDVHQSNDSTALSAAVNLAATKQYADQSQGSSMSGCGCSPHGSSSYGMPKDSVPYDGGSSYKPKECGCSSTGVQAVGQFAKTDQDASSSATSTQWYPSNSVTPVRIASPGSGGSVYQSNDSFAGSLALNAALTRQWVAQQQ